MFLLSLVHVYITQEKNLYQLMKDQSDSGFHEARIRGWMTKSAGLGLHAQAGILSPRHEARYEFRRFS